MVQSLVQKYLVLRGTTYHFRFVIPRDIRQIYPYLPREIKRSLRTDSLFEANAQVAEKLPTIHTLKNYHIQPEVRLNLIESLYFEKSTYSPTATKKETRKLKLSDAWKNFCEWKSWTDKQSKANQRLYENLKLFIGDRNIEDITKRVLKNALTSIEKLPKRNQSPYRNLTLQKISKMAVPEEHRVSKKYVKDHLKLCQSLFGRYLRDELDLISKAPTEGLVYDYPQNRFAAFTDQQITAIIPKLEHKPIWFKWLFLLALYTGARRSELMILTKSNFKTCNELNRYYLEINSGKTRAARRQVPISIELVDLGFIAWLDNQHTQPIFNVTLNRATDLFSSILADRTNFHGERFVFHSLRHTFITKARAAGLSNVLVQQVVGHEKTGAGQTDRYTHTFSLSDIVKVVDSVTFSGKSLL